jgi:hypothetical protein
MLDILDIVLTNKYGEKTTEIEKQCMEYIVDTLKKGYKLGKNKQEIVSEMLIKLEIIKNKYCFETFDEAMMFLQTTNY